MEYPVSAAPEEDIEKLADSVNLQRLSNSPAAFDHDQLAAMYRKIIKPAKPLGVRRNVLLNPGPATTTDTVKMAQVVPDICPREKEFGQIMRDIQADLVKIVHGDPEKYTSVLFCGSGTINIDVCINSLLPEGGKVLVLNNGSYSARAAEICEFYGLPFMQLQFPLDSQPDLALIEKTLQENPDIALVHIAHHETGTGLLNPIAIFDPVELEGTTVSRASVHNLNIMEDLQLGIGDTIRVYKANMIIPQISDNLTRSGKIEIPSACPVCGGPTLINDEDGTKTLVCANPDCLAKHVKKFSHFVSRDALNIEGLSESGLLKLIGIGALRTFPDLFRLSEHEDEIISMEGFGKKSFDNLIASAERARHTTPSRLLYGLGVPGIGVANSRNIARACRNRWNEIHTLDEDSLKTIDGVGSVMARDYAEYFENEDNAAMIRELIQMLDLDETFEAAGNKLEGKTFVITGSLDHYANRKDLKAEIEAEGGKVAGSVSAKTDYLITNNPGSGSSKNRDARALGVDIITEEQIMEMLGK